MEKKSLIIQNLKCEGCINTISKNIKKIDGIFNLKIDQKTSVISFVSTSENAFLVLKNKLKTTGYPSIDEDNSLLTKAKSFVSCANGRINK